MLHTPRHSLLESRIEREASNAVAREIENGASLYVRERDLPRLFPSWNLEVLSCEEIVVRLRGAIRAQAKALATNHWSADMNRCAALRMALRSEMRP